MSTKIASFRVADGDALPIPETVEHREDPAGLFSASVGSDTRVKPCYSEGWILSPSESTHCLASYGIDYGHVTISETPQGETEYALNPLEYAYPDSLNGIISSVIDRVRAEHLERRLDLDRDSVMGVAREILTEMGDDIEKECREGSDLDRLIDDVCAVVYRHSVGAGMFEILLSDPHIEDVFLDAPCDKNRIYVTVNGVKGVNSNIRCRTNVMLERKEVSNLINMLRRSSGLRYCQSNPVLETDMPGFDARATIIGYPMSPLGDALAIRKHSTRPWTLSRLIYNGTLDPETAGILSFLVNNRCTFLICGPRGAGKSSFLSALMFEFDKEQRILTIEDTLELPGEVMRKLGYKVQTILVDDRIDQNQFSRSEEALRVSLRMGESAIVLGEVRGDEARTLYQSMRVGKAGSSILGTIHGDSAESVFKRVVSDMGVSPESFLATDVIITLGTVKDKNSQRLIRRIEEFVCVNDVPGSFSCISDTQLLMNSPTIKRMMSSSQMGREKLRNEICARS